jgi:translation initiation factor 2 alpha subunit (eIF-2alpha)
MTHEQECIEATSRMLEGYAEIRAVIKSAPDCKALRCELTIAGADLPGIVIQFSDMVTFLPSLRLAVSNCVQKIQASRGLVVDVK